MTELHDDDLLAPREVAALLGVTTMTVRRMEKDGRLKAHHQRPLIFLGSEVKRALDTHTTKEQ